MAATSRDFRVMDAAGGVALAYLRLVREGDLLRASVVLGYFQRAWNTSFRSSFRADGYPDSELPTLPVDGRWGPPTARAIVVAAGQAGDLQVPLVLSEVPAFYAANYAVLEGDPAAQWEAFALVRDELPGDLPGLLEDWAEGLIEGLGASEVIADILRRSGSVQRFPSIPIRGQLVRTRQPLWPYAIVGGAVLLFGAGLAWRRWGRR